MWNGENMVGQVGGSIFLNGSYYTACMTTDGDNYNTAFTYRCTVVYLASPALEHILCL